MLKAGCASLFRPTGYLVINDDKATALRQLQAIVAAARCRTSQLWPQLAPRFLSNNP